MREQPAKVWEKIKRKGEDKMEDWDVVYVKDFFERKIERKKKRKNRKHKRSEDYTER